MTVAAAELLARLTEIRATDPDAVHRALAKRRHRPLLEHGSLFLIAADHPARGVLKVGADPMAMADRGELLRRLLTALGRPGVDGILGTADIIDDLALLGALDGKVVFGSMNRGGLTGFRFELDDRFTAYTVEGIMAAGLDGGKMMVGVADPLPVPSGNTCSGSMPPAFAIDDMTGRYQLAGCSSRVCATS